MSTRSRQLLWSAAVGVAVLVGVSALYLLWCYDFTTANGVKIHGLLELGSEGPPTGRGAAGDGSGQGGAVAVNPFGVLATLLLTALIVVLVAVTVVVSLVNLIRTSGDGPDQAEPGAAAARPRQ
jgi:hypothetical protein